MNRLEWFVNGKALGEHDVAAEGQPHTPSSDISQQVGARATSSTSCNGTAPAALTTYYSNDPRYEPARYGWFITSTNSLPQRRSPSPTPGGPPAT